MKRLAAAVIIVGLLGCNTLKEKTGEYVTEAMIGELEHRIEKELHKRDLSLAEVKEVADANADGKVTKAEVMATAKELAEDYVTLRLDAYEARKKAELTEATQKITDRFTSEGRQRRAEEKEELQRELSRLEAARRTEQESFVTKVRSGQVTEDEFKKHRESLQAWNERIIKHEEDLKKQSSVLSDVWNWLWSGLACVIAYLMKQVWGAKKAGDTRETLARTQAKIEFLEKLTGMDLNQNGTVGNGGPTPPPAPIEA